MDGQGPPLYCDVKSPTKFYAMSMSVLVLLIAAMLMTIVVGLLFGVVHQPIGGHRSYTDTRLGIELLTVPIAAVAAVLLRNRLAGIAEVRERSGIGPWLPLLVAVVLVTVASYLMWSWGLYKTPTERLEESFAGSTFEEGPPGENVVLVWMPDTAPTEHGSLAVGARVVGGLLASLTMFGGLVLYPRALAPLAACLAGTWPVVVLGLVLTSASGRVAGFLKNPSDLFLVVGVLAVPIALVAIVGIVFWALSQLPATTRDSLPDPSSRSLLAMSGWFAVGAFFLAVLGAGCGPGFESLGR